MKEFFKMFFASLLALAAAAFVMMLFFFILIGAIAALSKPAPVIADRSFLVFDLSAAIQDRPVQQTGQEVIDEAMGRASAARLSLRAVTRALREASKDSRINGLLLTGSFSASSLASGYPALKEVRAAVSDFAASGKPVWGYTVYPSSRDMYVLSAADRVYMNPEGYVADGGMVMGAPFFADFLERYGIGVQVTRAGEYKAAAESFVLNEMSEPSREATQALLDSVWSDYLATVTEGTAVNADGYEALLNHHGVLNAPQAREAGLVDELAFMDKLIADAKMVAEPEDGGEGFSQTDMMQYLKAMDQVEYSRDGYIAVIYAEGAIVVGEGGSDEVGGDSIAREIRRVRQDDDAKGLVLRVNSPGGSALASEVIQHEIRLAKETMPVAVSMGTMAASGGYWISAYADRIFAQPNTITGSIGVIGVFFNFEQLADRHGVHFDLVKTNQYADLMSMTRPKSEEEMALVQTQVDMIYESFLAKVAEGRGLPLDQVRGLAEGRIWSGEDALELGLVDEMGGLDSAIAYVADQAGLGDAPAVRELPEPKNFLDELVQNLSQGSAGAEAKALRPLVDIYDELRSYVAVYSDPKGVYAIAPYNLRID